MGSKRHNDSPDPHRHSGEETNIPAIRDADPVAVTEAGLSRDCPPPYEASHSQPASTAGRAGTAQPGRSSRGRAWDAEHDHDAGNLEPGWTCAANNRHSHKASGCRRGYGASKPDVDTSGYCRSNPMSVEAADDETRWAAMKQKNGIFCSDSDGCCCSTRGGYFCSDREGVCMSDRGGWFCSDTGGRFFATDGAYCCAGGGNGNNP